MDISSLKEHIVHVLESCKGQNITTIDIKNKASFADYLIIVSGTSQRHVISMADHLYLKLKPYTGFLKTEGFQKGDWVLIDAGNIVIHLFKTEVRQFYDLEKMWTSFVHPVTILSAEAC